MFPLSFPYLKWKKGIRLIRENKHIKFPGNNTYYYKCTIHVKESHCWHNSKTSLQQTTRCVLLCRFWFLGNIFLVMNLQLFGLFIPLTYKLSFWNSEIVFLSPFFEVFLKKRVTRLKTIHSEWGERHFLLFFT